MSYATAPDHAGVEVIGHRGSPRAVRENTLPSFARAFEDGATAVELDVHRTRDGAVVVHHDPSTNARPGESGQKTVIAAASLAELRDVQIGDGTSIPTLAELLAIIPSNAVAFVEVKAPAMEEAVVSVIRASNRQCAVHSFDHRIARRVRQIAPEIPVGILQTSYPVDPLRPLRDADARDLWQHWELIDEALVTAVHRDGRRLIAWTVNDDDVARRLVTWGVDGICTDVPAAVRRLVDSLQ